MLGVDDVVAAVAAEAPEIDGLLARTAVRLVLLLEGWCGVQRR